MRLDLLLEIVHIATGMLVIGSQRVNKSLKISYQTNADFFQLKISQIHGEMG